MIQLAEQSKAWVCGLSPAETAGSNPAGSMYVSCGCCVLSEVCASGRLLIQRSVTECGVSTCVEVSASGRSLIQRSVTECGVSKCVRDAWTVRRSWLTGGFAPWEKEVIIYTNLRT